MGGIPQNGFKYTIRKNNILIYINMYNLVLYTYYYVYLIQSKTIGSSKQLNYIQNN